MSAQASFWFLEDLNIIRSEPPTNVNALPAGPVGIGATPTFLRAAGTQFLSSVRSIESKHPRAADPDGEPAALELVLDLRAVTLELALVEQALRDQVGHELDALLRPRAS